MQVVKVVMVLKAESSLDLHADAEEWSDNRDGTDRKGDNTCAACGGARVVFIPVWADGGGILTPEEIGEVLGRAKAKVRDLAAREAGWLPAVTEGALAGDVVLRIEGFRDGHFRAWIIHEDLDESKRWAPGEPWRSSAAGWRHGLRKSTRVTEVTTPRERDAGMLVFAGEPQVLNFGYKAKWLPDRRPGAGGSGERAGYVSRVTGYYGPLRKREMDEPEDRGWTGPPAASGAAPQESA